MCIRLWYHSVNRISLSRYQSYPIKLCPLNQNKSSLMEDIYCLTNMKCCFPNLNWWKTDGSISNKFQPCILQYYVHQGPLLCLQQHCIWIQSLHFIGHPCQAVVTPPQQISVQSQLLTLNLSPTTSGYQMHHSFQNPKPSSLTCSSSVSWKILLVVCLIVALWPLQSY